MSLLTAPFRFAGRRVDDLARTVLPSAVRRRLPCRFGGPPDRGRVAPGPRMAGPPPADDARARAERARHEAITYLHHRRARLRRELEARR